MEYFIRLNYNKILSDYSRAREWLQSYGVSLENSRFERYSKLLIKMGLATVSSKNELFKAHSAKIISATYEVSSLISIHKGLMVEELNGLKEKLRGINKGPDHYSEEVRNSNASRNSMFELSTAATFKNMGIQIEIDKRADVIAIRNGEKIFVECKRPQKRETLEENLVEAIDQITGDLEGSADPNDKGLIHVDVDRVINRNLFLREFETVEEFEKEIHQLVQINMQDVCSKIRSRCRPSIMGIVAKVKVPARFKSENIRVSFGSFHLFFLLHEKIPENRIWLSKFMEDYLFAWNIDHRSQY